MKSIDMIPKTSACVNSVKQVHVGKRPTFWCLWYPAIDADEVCTIADYGMCHLRKLGTHRASCFYRVD